MSEEPKAETEKEERYLTEVEWAQVVELWEMGEVTLDDLAKQFKVTPGAISKGLKKRGATKGAKAAARAAAIAAAAAAGTAAAVKTFAEERKLRIEQTKTDHYNWSTTISKLAMKELLECQKKGAAFATVDANLRALRRAMAILSEARIERYELLDAKGEVDEKELPQLLIENLTEEEIEKLRSMAEEDELEVELPKEISEEVVVEGE
jgi:hypothetical protein